MKRVGATSTARRLFSSHSVATQTHGVKSGSGGRSSNSNITATVFGAYGFIGRYFINELGEWLIILTVSAIVHVVHQLNINICITGVSDISNQFLHFIFFLILIFLLIHSTLLMFMFMCSQL